jgi:hypothetical protein
MTPANMQTFVGLIILKAQVMGYASVFQVAAVIILIGAFASFLIKVNREDVTHEHSIVVE